MSELFILFLVGVGVYLIYQDCCKPPADEEVRSVIEKLMAKLDLDVSDVAFDAACERIFRAYQADRPRVCLTLGGYDVRVTILRKGSKVEFTAKGVPSGGDQPEPVELGPPEDDTPPKKPTLRDKAVEFGKQKAKEWAERQLRRRL